ncbi:hypothetical protein KI387_037443, partial [Taxus chinensis]
MSLPNLKNKRQPFKGLGLEHMNNAHPVIPAVLDTFTVRSIIFQVESSLVLSVTCFGFSAVMLCSVHQSMIGFVIILVTKKCSSVQVDIFHLRERNLLERLAMEISQFVSQGKSTGTAFTMSYKLAEDLGRAFSQRAVLDSVISAEAKLSSSDSMKDVLGLLRTLYVLVNIEEDISFLRYGYLTPQQSKVIQKEVGNLCKELRPHALALVDSFGIPQPFLSPIAFDWVEANS